MNVVGSAAHGGIELSAGGVTEFRSKLIDDDGELTDGVSGKINQWAGDALVVIVDAFDRVIVGFWPQSAYGGTLADA